MQASNPYATPNAPVENLDNESTGDIRLFTPQGRLGRVRYFYYSFLVGLVGMIIMALAAALATGISPMIGGILMAAVYIGMLVISFFLIIQRCHDLNKSGWWSLLMLVPFAFLYFYFAPGTPGQNQFGLKPPKNTKLVIIGAIVLPILMIVVMGILSAVATPALSNQLEKAKSMNTIEQAD